MTGWDGPRPMRPEEYGQVMAVLERAFGLPEHHWLTQYPGTARERFVWDDHFVICEQGRVVSHAALYPRTLVVEGDNVPLGGVGSVATDPDFQGRGHFSRLMQHLTGVMRGRGIPLAVLWGRTSRYRHFGYEPAGRRMAFRLSGKPASAAGAVMGRVRGLRPNEDLAWTLAAHSGEPLHIARTSDGQLERLTGGASQTWVTDGEGARAYVVLDDGRVLECAGEPQGVLDLLAYLRNHYYPAGFEVLAPYRDGPVLRGLFDMGAAWRVETIGMFAIIELQRLLRAFAQQLQRRAIAAGLPRGARLFLRNTDTGELCSITWEDEVTIGGESGAEAIPVTSSQLTRLLLGLSLERHGRNEVEQRLLDCLFPLDLYIHPLDSV